MESISAFESAGVRLHDALKGLSRDQLLAHPIPGTWSIQEIVIHLMDSDGIGVDRMKRTIAEPKPLLMGYDENAYMSKLFTDEQDARVAVEIFDLTRRQFAVVLKRLAHEAFERKAVHSEAGLVSLRDQLEKYVKHFEHHFAHLERKRSLLLGH